MNKEDYDLHIQAGLEPAGINDDGEQEWVGDNTQWEIYDKLSSKEPEDE